MEMNPRLQARDACSIVRCPALFLMGEHKAVVSYLVCEPVRGGCSSCKFGNAVDTSSLS